MIPKYFKRSPSKLLAAIALSLAAMPPALAQEFTVADIRLEGLQRISASSVFGLLNIRVGDRIDSDDVSNIIRDVFSSNYFSNIEVLVEEDVLVIRVEERPTVS